MPSKPLRGKIIAVTRPKDQADSLALKLRSAGARVILTPTIRIRPLSPCGRLDAALRRIDSYDTMIFTSANAVHCFFDRARRLRLGVLRKPRRLYAVGSRTAQELALRGWRGAHAPKDHRGEALAALLGDVRGRNILIPRAKIAREILPSLLRKNGARVSVAACYETIADKAGLKRLAGISQKNVHAITFTSASTVDQLMAHLGPSKGRALLNRTVAASIGPITSAALKKHGVRSIVQAEKSTSSGLYAALILHFKSRDGLR